MDKIDRKIMNYLVKDASMPFSKIAKNIGVGTDTVIRRYKALEREGIIKRALWNFDYSKCGIKGRLDILIRIDPNEDKKILSGKILDIKNVINVNFTEGDYDLLVLAFFSDIDQLDQIYNAISKMNGVLRIDICICLISRFPVSRIMNKHYSIISNA